MRACGGAPSRGGLVGLGGGRVMGVTGLSWDPVAAAGTRRALVGLAEAVSSGSGEVAATTAAGDTGVAELLAVAAQAWGGDLGLRAQAVVDLADGVRRAGEGFTEMDVLLAGRDVT